MSRKRPKVTGEKQAGVGDKAKAQEIAMRVLGPSYQLDYELLPPSVGVVGDERKVGRSLLISGPNSAATRSLIEEACRAEARRSDCLGRKVAPDIADERLQQVSSAMCNETAATRVLIEIFPRNSVSSQAWDN